MRAVLTSLWRDYRAAEDRGYRAEYLRALSELVDAATAIEDRDELARLVFRTRERSSKRFTLREPLRSQILVPFARAYLADPQVMWWGLTTRVIDHDALDAYRHYDHLNRHPVAGAITYCVALTGEPRWWQRLLDHRLSVVEYGTHHLDEGRGVVDGPTLDYVLQLCAAVAAADQAPPGAVRPDQRAGIVEQWSLLRDWVRYDTTGRPGGDFPGWCRRQGSEHWVAHHTGRRHYYYGAPAPS